MAGKTDAFEADLLKWVTHGTPTIIGGPANTPTIGLFTTSPTDSAAGTEVTGGSYARVSSSGSWTTPTAGSVVNNADINFATATADWGSLVAFGIFSGAGVLLYYGNLVDGSNNPVTKIVGNGDTFAFKSGTLTVTED